MANTQSLNANKIPAQVSLVKCSFVTNILEDAAFFFFSVFLSRSETQCQTSMDMALDTIEAADHSQVH